MQVQIFLLDFQRVDKDLASRTQNISKWRNKMFTIDIQLFASKRRKFKNGRDSNAQD